MKRHIHIIITYTDAVTLDADDERISLRPEPRLRSSAHATTGGA